MNKDAFSKTVYEIAYDYANYELSACEALCQDLTVNFTSEIDAGLLEEVVYILHINIYEIDMILLNQIKEKAINDAMADFIEGQEAKEYKYDYLDEVRHPDYELFERGGYDLLSRQ